MGTYPSRSNSTSDAAGLVINLHFFLCSGLSIVPVERYDFLRMLDMIQRFQITTLILVPPQAVSLCKHPATRTRGLRSVKRITVGAAPVPKELHHLLEEVFPQAHIGQAYGLTEATCTISMHSSQKGPPGSAGKILPGIETRVYKEDGSRARAGELGELCVKSPSVALGYLNNEAANRETFKDGWVRTGDQVFITEQGDIFIQDRIKDFIKVKGFQVAPAELEGCILDHPDVRMSVLLEYPTRIAGKSLEPSSFFRRLRPIDTQI
ncbi:hypothetical protein PM082_017233 [Marasmius tenuissimus]|nr:hypothetical protein PM082_017233 [Marasmius tenuissimus]